MSLYLLSKYGAGANSSDSVIITNPDFDIVGAHALLCQFIRQDCDPHYYVILPRTRLFMRVYDDTIVNISKHTKEISVELLGDSYILFYMTHRPIVPVLKMFDEDVSDFDLKVRDYYRRLYSRFDTTIEDYPDAYVEPIDNDEMLQTCAQLVKLNDRARSYVYLSELNILQIDPGLLRSFSEDIKVMSSAGQTLVFHEENAMEASIIFGHLSSPHDLLTQVLLGVNKPTIMYQNYLMSPNKAEELGGKFQMFVYGSLTKYEAAVETADKIKRLQFQSVSSLDS